MRKQLRELRRQEAQASAVNTEELEPQVPGSFQDSDENDEPVEEAEVETKKSTKPSSGSSTSSEGSDTSDSDEDEDSGDTNQARPQSVVIQQVEAQTVEPFTVSDPEEEEDEVVELVKQESPVTPAEPIVTTSPTPVVEKASAGSSRVEIKHEELEEPKQEPQKVETDDLASRQTKPAGTVQPVNPVKPELKIETILPPKPPVEPPHRPPVRPPANPPPDPPQSPTNPVDESDESDDEMAEENHDARKAEPHAKMPPLHKAANLGLSVLDGESILRHFEMLESCFAAAGDLSEAQKKFYVPYYVTSGTIRELWKHLPEYDDPNATYWHYKQAIKLNHPEVESWTEGSRARLHEIFARYSDVREDEAEKVARLVQLITMEAKKLNKHVMKVTDLEIINAFLGCLTPSFRSLLRSTLQQNTSRIEEFVALAPLLQKRRENDESEPDMLNYENLHPLKPMGRLEETLQWPVVAHQAKLISRSSRDNWSLGGDYKGLGSGKKVKDDIRVLVQQAVQEETKELKTVVEKSSQKVDDFANKMGEFFEQQLAFMKRGNAESSQPSYAHATRPYQSYPQTNHWSSSGNFASGSSYQRPFSRPYNTPAPNRAEAPCYWCHEKGHYMRDCPEKLSAISNGMFRIDAQGRPLFAPTGEVLEHHAPGQGPSFKAQIQAKTEASQNYLNDWDHEVAQYVQTAPTSMHTNTPGLIPMSSAVRNGLYVPPHNRFNTSISLPSQMVQAETETPSIPPELKTAWQQFLVQQQASAGEGNAMGFR